MIIARPRAEFRADFPDDHVWNEDETEVVQTGGKAIAEAIADILASLGCVIDELTDNVGHCWECQFSYEGLALQFYLGGLDPWILTRKSRTEPHAGSSATFES